MSKNKSDCQTWACFTEESPCGVAGYLITEPGRLNEPIAYIRIRGSGSDLEGAYNFARLIADNHSLMELFPAAQDLRQFAKLDSNRPTPGFLFSLWCLECEDGAEPEGEDLNEPVQQPIPFCRFRLARMTMQFNRLVPHEADAAKMPYHTVGMSEYPDGTGSNETHVIAAIDEPLSIAQMEELIGSDPDNYNDEKIRGAMAK
jgi:hypothetical protein